MFGLIIELEAISLAVQQSFFRCKKGGIEPSILNTLYPIFSTQEATLSQRKIWLNALHDAQ